MTIRKVRISDAERLLEIYSPYVLNTAVSFEYDVPSLGEFERRIKDISLKYPYIAAEDEGKIIAYAYASAFKPRKAYDWAVESTIYVDSEYRGKGVGKALYSCLEELLKRMGITNMNACIAYAEQEDEYLQNHSEAFHKKLGFNKVAHFHGVGYKFGKKYDMIWMEKIIGAKIGELKSFSEIGADIPD